MPHLSGILVKSKGTMQMAAALTLERLATKKYDEWNVLVSQYRYGSIWCVLWISLACSLVWCFSSEVFWYFLVWLSAGAVRSIQGTRSLGLTFGADADDAL